MSTFIERHKLNGNYHSVLALLITVPISIFVGLAIAAIQVNTFEKTHNGLYAQYYDDCAEYNEVTCINGGKKVLPIGSRLTYLMKIYGMTGFGAGLTLGIFIGTVLWNRHKRSTV